YHPSLHLRWGEHDSSAARGYQDSEERHAANTVSQNDLPAHISWIDNDPFAHRAPHSPTVCHVSETTECPDSPRFELLLLREPRVVDNIEFPYQPACGPLRVLEQIPSHFLHLQTVGMLFKEEFDSFLRVRKLFALWVSCARMRGR